MTRGYNAAFITTSWKDLESQDLPNVFVRRDRVTMVHVIETGGNWSAVRPSFFNQKCFSKLYHWVNTHDVNYTRTCGIGEISWTHPQQSSSENTGPNSCRDIHQIYQQTYRPDLARSGKNLFSQTAGTNNGFFFSETFSERECYPNTFFLQFA